MHKLQNSALVGVTLAIYIIMHGIDNAKGGKNKYFLCVEYIDCSGKPKAKGVHCSKKSSLFILNPQS
jgi:hypothetical protein